MVQDYSGPDGSGTVGQSAINFVFKTVDAKTGAPVTYTAGIQFATSSFSLPSVRSFAPVSSTFGTTVNFVGGNRDPYGSNQVSVSLTGALASSTVVSPSQTSQTLSFNTMTSNLGNTPGTYTNVAVTGAAGYEGSKVVAFNFTLSGKVYATATGTFNPTASTSYFHVGDAASISFVAANTTQGALADSMGVSLSPSTPGIVTGVSSPGYIAQGQSATVTLGLNTSVAGAYAVSDSNLSFASHDADLADVAASVGGSANEVYVNNYADPIFVDTSTATHPGVLTQAGNSWTLNLGNILVNSSNPTATEAAIYIENGTSSAARDTLSGTVSVSGATFNQSVSTLAGDTATAGGELNLGDFIPNVSAVGANTETIVFHPVGSNPSGFSAALPDQTLTVTDNVFSASSVSVADFSSDEAALNGVAGGFTVADSAADVAAGLGALAADAAHILAVSLTDATTPVLNLTAAQVASDASVLAKISGPYDVTIAASGQPYSSYTELYANGSLAGVDYTFSNVTGQPYSSYQYDYNPGNEYIGSKFFYTNVSREPYTGYEYDYDGGGHVTRVAFTGVTGAAYSAYEYDYVGGVYAGAKFEFTTVPVGASYSSYETDYNAVTGFTGDKFFFTDIAGQSYTGEEEDFNAMGQLTRVLLSGVTGHSYDALEEDYSGGSYAGYKAYYAITGQTYSGEEVDVSAANALTRVVYTGLTGTPYSSVAEDFANGAVTDTVYDFTNPTGQSFYAYQATDDASGNALQETVDNNDGSHTVVGFQADQTFTSSGDDSFTGGAASQTFVFNPVFGHDTITDFSSYLSGAGHDTISLASAEFANFAAVLASAQNVNGNAVITAANGDTLTLNNTTTSALAANPGDFTFHS